MITSGPNDVVVGKGFYVSYNCRDTISYGDVTTGIVNENMTNFQVLLGDHRKQLHKLIPKGYQACLAYVLRNRKLRHRYSDPLPHESARIMRIVTSFVVGEHESLGSVRMVCGHLEWKPRQTLMRLSRGLTNVCVCSSCTEQYLNEGKPEDFRIGKRTILLAGDNTLR